MHQGLCELPDTIRVLTRFLGVTSCQGAVLVLLKTRGKNLWKPTDAWVAGRPNRSLQMASISGLRPDVRRTCKKERKTSTVRSRVFVSSPTVDLEMDTARVRNDPRSTNIVDAVAFFSLINIGVRGEYETYLNQAKKQ